MGAMDSEAGETSTGKRIDRSTLIVVALLAVALLWRLVFFFEMYASPYGDNLSLDSQVYHEVALAAAAGEWSHGETFFQAPLYPWVLGRRLFVGRPQPDVRQAAPDSAQRSQLLVDLPHREPGI